MCPEKENNKDSQNVREDVQNVIKDEQLVESQLQGSELTDYNPTEASEELKPEEKITVEPDTGVSQSTDGIISNQNGQNEADKLENNADKHKTGTIIDILAPGLILMAITTVIALLLSVLNFVTKDVISEQTTAKKREAVASIFGEDIDEVLTPFEGEVSEPVSEINLVTKNGKVLGFSVAVSPKGYAGAIDMLVGVNLDNTVKGVRIIEENETAGVGTKVKDEAFLYQFMRLVYEIKANEQDNSVDLISGATISSKAVLSGVNAALERTLAIDIGAYVEQETDVIPSESLQEATQAETTAVSTEVLPTQPADMTQEVAQ